MPDLCFIVLVRSTISDKRVKESGTNYRALDGGYVTSGERLILRRVPPPKMAALEANVRVISERVGRALERQGLLVRDL